MNSLASDLWFNFNFSVSWTFYTLALSFRSAGHHHVPAKGPLLVLANHTSFLDPIAVGLAVRRRVYFLARKSLFRSPWFGTYLKSVGCIPVDIEGFSREGLRLSQEVLQAGKPLLVFPEGSRTEDGEMVPFKPGIALLLRKGDIPIVPVGIAGAFESFPMHQKVPKLSPLFWSSSGTGVAVSVGPIILPQAYAGMDRERLLSFLFDRVKDQVELARNMVRRTAE